MYYLYGKGINGESIASFLELYFPKESYTFIDDSQEETSLASLRGHIAQDDKILIASTLHYDKIVQNLQQYDLLNYENGITWCGEIINNQLKEYKQRHSFKKYVGLVVHQYTERHFVDLESQLKGAGYGVVYFAFHKGLYKKYAKGNFCLFAPHAIVETIQEVDMMLLTNLTPTNQKVISMDITHGFQGILYRSFKKLSPTEEEFLKYTFSTADYVVCGSKKIHRAYEEFFEGIQEKPILLDTGYLKLDKDVQEYEKFCKQQQVAGIKPQNDIVIFAFTFFDEIERIVALIKECFKLNLRASFKPHPVFAEKLMPKISEAFMGENRFIKIESKEELFYHSICLVTDCSSIGYTYPLTTAKPSICLDMNIGNGEDNKVESYYEEKLMYLCQNDSEFCRSLKTILQEQESYPSKVEWYRQNECFNFGNSSQKLLEQIQMILGE